MLCAYWLVPTALISNALFFIYTVLNFVYVCRSFSLRTGAKWALLKETNCFVCLLLAPIIKSGWVDVFSQIAIFKSYVCVISPRASYKAAFFIHGIFSGKSAISSYEAYLNICRCRWSKDVSLFYTDELTVIKVSCCSTENEIYTALDRTVFEIERAPFTLCKLLRSDKSSGDYLLLWQRS